MNVDAKGREINEQWFKDRANEYKEYYKKHYLPAKLKAKGVFPRYGKWVANIKYFSENIHLGTYATEAEARAVHKKALQDFLDNFDDYWDQYYKG